MYSVDDAHPPNSDKHGGDSSAVRRHNKYEEIVIPPERKSSDAPRITFRHKLSTLPLPLRAAEVGFVRKVSAGDEERISPTKQKPKNIASKEERRSPTPKKVFSSPTKAEAITTPPNAPPQQAISNPKCEKKSARIRRHCEKSKREKFSVSLSHHEIEQDFMAMTGKKAPGKPKKRPRVVQNQINAILPGQCLSEVHANQYKVKGNRKL